MINKSAVTVLKSNLNHIFEQPLKRSDNWDRIKINRIRLSIFLFVCIILLSLTSPAFGEWEYEIIDPEGYGGYVTQVLDSQGNQHLAYYDSGAGDVKYACWDGSNWQIEIVDSAGDVGAYMSFTLDEEDHPHIAYYEDLGVSMGHLKYAHWNGDSWAIETVDSGTDTGTDTGIDIDSNGYPHISYVDNANTHLKYARWDGSSWQLETIDDTDFVGFYGDIVLDDDDHAHICYRDNGIGILRYAEWDGNDWQLEIVDNDADERVGAFTSIALDSNGYTHISYYDWPDNLRYAHWNGTNWDIEIVDSGGRHTSLVLDENGYPNISHDDYATTSLKYARWDGNSWHTETVDNSGVVGGATGLILDNFSAPYITYQDLVNGDLLYARYINEDAVIVQEHYRWRNDDGDEASATWIAYEDIGVMINSDDNIRIRFDLSNRGASHEVNLYNANLQYSIDEVTWENITTDASVNHFVLSLSDHFSDGDPTPSDFLTNETNTQASGEMYETTANFGGNFPIETGFEYEWCIKPTLNAQNFNYFFRIYGSVTGGPQNNIFSNEQIAVLTYESGLTFDPPSNLFVTEHGYATWNAPASKDLLGYNVYLNSEFLENVTATNYQFTDLVFGQVYTGGVSAVYDDGVSEIIDIDFTYTETSVGNEIIARNELLDNYPNPFNPETTISFYLSSRSTESTELLIYNVKGQKVKTLICETLQAGYHSVIWNGTDDKGNNLVSGIYFYKMKNGRYISTKKMILMK